MGSRSHSTPNFNNFRLWKYFGHIWSCFFGSEAAAGNGASQRDRIWKEYILKSLRMADIEDKTREHQLW